jgi:hypothetical protein
MHKQTICECILPNTNASFWHVKSILRRSIGYGVFSISGSSLSGHVPQYAFSGPHQLVFRFLQSKDNPHMAQVAQVSSEDDRVVRQSIDLSRHKGFGGDKKLFLEIISKKRSENQADGSESLTFPEFKKVFGIKDNQLAQDLFRAFDLDGSGKITLDELQSMADLLAKGDPISRVDRMN